MAKVMDEIDLAFIETPLKKGVEAKPKVAKTKHDPFQGLSSWTLVRELTSRHYKFVLRAVFYMGLGAVIVIITRG